MRLETFLGWLEPQLGEFGALRGMADWASKLAGAIARIASLLHLAAHADKPEPWSDFVSPATMEQAIKLGMYLLAHAQAAYAEMAADPLVQDARYLLRWIERNGGCAFTKRDAFEGTKGRFERVPQLEPVLALLQQHGYIRVRTTPTQLGPGRKPSPIYEVNPLWDSHNSHNAECDLDPHWLGEETTPLDNHARFNLVSIA